MASGNSHPVRTGAYIGTGALITVESVGYRPKRVKLFNTDTFAVVEHLDTMDAGTGANITGGAVIATNCITLTDSGFTVGTDAALNNSGDQVHWVAEG